MIYRLLPLFLLCLLPLVVHSETIVVPAGGNVQPAINGSQCGDKIVLQAGVTYLAPADFVAYVLPVKSCSATNPVVITSSSAPPANGVRVAIADRPEMPKLVARVGSPGFFDVQSKAHDYCFSYLWFTNQKRADGSGTSYLIGGGAESGLDVNNFPYNITIDHCFFNNLAYGDVGPDLVFNIRPKVFTGQHGDGIEFSHNTVLQTGEIIRSGSGNPRLASLEQITNFVWKDNITNWGTGSQYGFACLNSTTGSNEPCAPNYVWTKSVMIGAPTGPLSDGRSMTNFPSGNFNPATIADVKFIDPATSNYRLAADSPYKRAASDGKDIGVDMDQLLAHLGGSITLSPTPR